MKLAVSLALVLSLVAGCSRKKSEEQPDRIILPETPTPAPGSGSAPAKPVQKTGAELGAVYTGCVALIGSGKVDDFKTQCLADNYVGHEVGGNQRTRDSMMDNIKRVRTAFPDLKLAPQTVLVSGNTVLAVVLMTGTNAADGKKVGALFFDRLDFDAANKVAEEWEYADDETLLAQAGQPTKELGESRPPLDKGVDAPEIVVTTNNATEKTNHEVVRKAIEAVNAHKAADAAAAYADDGAVESDQAAPKDVTGKKDIEAALQDLMKAFPDVKLDVPAAQLYAAGDYVVALGTLTGTNDGPLHGMKPTKKKVSAAYAEIGKLKDGKIVKLWRFHDRTSFAQQLGVLPEKKAAAPDPKTGSAEPPKTDAPAPKMDAPKADAPKADAPKK